MRRIELRTGGGDFVACVEILPFPKGPDVVAWGERLFVPRPGETDVYYEAFGITSVTPSPGLPRELESAPEPAAEVAPVDRSAITTLHGTPVDELRLEQALHPLGKHADYIVLSDEERSKGYVRPVRDTYKHLTCGTTTTMGRKLAETYARDPGFYSATFCCSCNAHLLVGAHGEFVWDGTDIKVGT